MFQQPNPQEGGHSMVIAMLLQDEAVRNDLGISRQSAEEAMSALRDLRGRLEPEMQGMLMMPAEDRVAAMTKLNKKIADSVESALGLILEDAQVSRLKQLYFQRKGLEAFSNPEAQARLKLSPAQFGELREIIVQTNAQAKEIVAAARESGNREEGIAQITAFKKEALEKAVAVLDDSQKSTWKEMTGEPFEFKMQAPGGRPGMGGPGMGGPGIGGPGMGGRPGMRGKQPAPGGSSPLDTDDELF